jgi:nitrate reductase molybdenum cofactor assembly chaperone NarJ/NarW
MKATKTMNDSTLRNTLRAIARLLAYPDAGLRSTLPALRAALHADGVISATGRAAMDRLLDVLSVGDGLEVEAAYVECFDRGRSTSLHLFEHVHGDSRDRGPAMVDLARTYGQAGLNLVQDELPDYLPVVLEFASTRPAAEARAFLGEMAHVLNALHTALQTRRSPYAALIAALLEIAGERPQNVALAPDEPLDASWAEPAAFDRCSMQGQAKPGQPQPVHIVRKITHGAAR